MAALLVNPRKRRAKRKTARKSPAKRRRPSVASVRTVSTRKYRRNPARRSAKVMDTVKEGAIGAAGAIASEFIMSKLPLPASMNTATTQPVISALVSVGVGMAMAKFGKKPAIGKAMAQGGVTVALHQTMRGFVASPLGLPASAGVASLAGYYGEDHSHMGYVEPTQTYENPEMNGYFTGNEHSY